MKAILFTLFLVPVAVFGNEDLVAILTTEGPSDYFPANADFETLPEICNSSACFRAVLVDYVSETNKGMRRLAIFDEANNYLGCYSGLPDVPRGVEDERIIFPKSEYGSEIVFGTDTPPGQIWLDGDVIPFDESREHH